MAESLVNVLRGNYIVGTDPPTIGAVLALGPRFQVAVQHGAGAVHGGQGAVAQGVPDIWARSLPINDANNVA